MAIRTSRLISILGLAAIAGFAIFGVMAWRNVTVDIAERKDALTLFNDVRSLFGDSQPLLRVEADGHVTRTREPLGEGPPPKQFRVLAYRAPERRLVRANIAFWFLRAKGPAVKYALRGTGLDLDRLRISPDDLRRYGAGLVLDETAADGSRLLVWTE